MDIERIFPIIIILIIWGVSSAIRKSPKGNAGANKSAPGTGLMELLQRRIQTALEVADGEELVELDSYIEPTAETAFPQANIDVAALRRRELVVQPESPKPERQKKKNSNDSSRSCPIGGETRLRDRSNRQVDLKKAIIWAEILAPPVGLRDQ